MKKFVLFIVAALCFLLMTGTAGALERDTIQFTRGVLYLIAEILVFASSITLGRF